MRLLASDWDRMYREGQWDYLKAPEQAARNGILSAWIAEMGGRARVVDLGCGEGALLSFLPEAALSAYLGIDHSAEAIDRARRTWLDKEGVSFVQRNVEEMDFSRFGAGDIVLFNEVLYCLRDPLRLLDILLRNRACVLFSITDMQQELSRIVLSVFRETLWEQARCSDDKRGKAWTLGMLRLTR